MTLKFIVQPVSAGWRDWKLSDLVYGVVVPTIVAFLIIGVSMITDPSLIGIKYALLQAIVIVGVPMLLGFIWNQWAGGACGFLLGSVYALYFNALYALVSAMLIGYIAGALNKRSDNLLRMLIAGVTSGFMGALLVAVVNQFTYILGEPSVGGIAIIFLPRVFAGVIVPIIARAFLRHGAKRSNSN